MKTKWDIPDEATGWYYVYILLLNDGSRYVGLTHNLIARLLRIALGEYSTIIQDKGYDHLLNVQEFRKQEEAIEFKDKMIAGYDRQGITCWPPHIKAQDKERDKYVNDAKLMREYGLTLNE